MSNINDVRPEDLIEEVAEELKKIPQIKAPEWSMYVKTGGSRERVPDNPEWWHIRAASMLRKVAILGPIGVSKLRRKYGGRKHRGSRPEHFVRGSGSIVRKIFQQLEAAKLIEKVEKDRKGRKISPKGMSLLDKASIKIIKSNKPAKKKEEKPQEKKAEAKNE